MSLRLLRRECARTKICINPMQRLLSSATDDLLLQQPGHRFLSQSEVQELPLWLLVRPEVT